MNKNFRLGIIRETKTPPDKRVPITPAQVDAIHTQYPHVSVCVEPSAYRCFTNDEYKYLDVPLECNMETCDLLMGVKEVKIDALIPGKTYFFFAHVAKKQPHNRELLKAVLEKKITLIDYEYLTKPDGTRIVAFGRWAGIVGAYNALRARGNRTNNFKLKPAHECHDMEELFAGLRKITLKPIKILITGGGRVAGGAIETLSQLNLRRVTPKEYLTETFDEPVYCLIEPNHYVKRKDGQLFDMLHFINNPAEYESVFKPYTKTTDIFIACHFWDNRSPHFIEKEDYLEPDFKITVIADISCDVPGPIHSTLRATTIENPFFGYNPSLSIEEPAFIRPTNITIMSVDNLPGELPRDASRDFGHDLFERVFPALFGDDGDGIIERATITKDGKLTPKFAYLQDYVDEKE
ncbi:MAG: alanine dehydrogenase [Bacteroidetes bacterium GWF2_40_13]|nr:MAG: alanine dehydrogenase [Bacteroidetes bacterium GWF2_40_13]